jgi:hypothetical protein
MFYGDHFAVGHKACTFYVDKWLIFVAVATIENQHTVVRC